MHVLQKLWVKRTVFLTHEVIIEFLTNLKVFNPWDF